MNLRYMYLSVQYQSGFGEDFDEKFRYNTWILGNYLSRHVRKLHLKFGGEYNLFGCKITNMETSLNMSSYGKYLSVNLHVSDSEIQEYLSMRSERDRFEFYFSLLERGCRYAAQYHTMPVNDFLKLHQQFRDGGYKNEWLFKKKMLRDYGIKVILEHVLTSYAYDLRLTVTDLKGNYINSGSIYTTYPDDIFFNKNVRHLVITDDKLVVTDLIDKPQFECNLENLANGIISSACLSENTKKYIPNEENKEDFARLRWD